MIVSSPSVLSCLFGTFLLLKVNHKDLLIIDDMFHAVHVD